MSSIADRTGLPASTITSIMDRLVGRGLAERHRGATDRRSITGSITEEGLQIPRAREAQRDASLSTMLADFTDDELNAIMKLIDRWAELTDVD
jgi:DNA-binding MarR family transcriptional regulator